MLLPLAFLACDLHQNTDKSDHAKFVKAGARQLQPLSLVLLLMQVMLLQMLCKLLHVSGALAQTQSVWIVKGAATTLSRCISKKRHMAQEETQTLQTPAVQLAACAA